MIAYRAETALVSILRRHLQKEEEARALIRELFVSSADFVPDTRAKTLSVKIHRMASPAHDRAIAALRHELNWAAPSGLRHVCQANPGRCPGLSWRAPSGLRPLPFQAARSLAVDPQQG